MTREDCPYLTTTEAAMYCGFKTGSAIRRLMMVGKLRSAGRRGGTGCHMFLRSELNRYLTERPSYEQEMDREVGSVDSGESDPAGSVEEWRLPCLKEARRIASRVIRRGDEPTGRVYFLQSKEGQPIKIGYATDAVRRMEGVQTGHPYKLRIVAQIPGDMGLERRLHHAFQRYRLEGEWFESADILMTFVRLMGGRP